MQPRIASAQWVVRLLQYTTALPWGQWAEDLLQNSATLPMSSGQWSFYTAAMGCGQWKLCHTTATLPCCTLPHCYMAVGC